MLFINEMFISQLLKKPVIDRSGEKIGHITDIVIEIGGLYPKVTGFEVGTFVQKYIINHQTVDVINKRILSLKFLKDDVYKRELREHEIYLQKDLLDKQIVDTYGCKVVRINDLKLANFEGDIRLVAVDIGLKGLLRRLGIESPVVRFAGLFGNEIGENIISWDYMEPLETELSRVKLTVPHEKVSRLHPADIADIMSQLNVKEQVAIIKSLDHETAAEALGEVEPEMQAAIMETLEGEHASDILEEMAVDEAADLLGELSEEKARELLGLMDEAEAEEVQELLEYDEETAGGLMTTEFIALPAFLTADQTINQLRELAPEAETIYYLYVVDQSEKLVGVVSLRDMIVSPADTPLLDIMIKKVISVEHDTPQKQVADIIAKYNLLAVPVVDEERKIIGIVTVDDVIDLMYPVGRQRKPSRYGAMADYRAAAEGR
ncbi:MAG: magnesium transporter [Eubacteriales bacterium]